MAEEPSSAANASTSVPFKRSLFNKPAWSKPQSNLDSSDFFKRSNITHSSVATEEELKRKKHEARKLQERARSGQTEERERKKRRISSNRSETGSVENIDDGGYLDGREEVGGSVKKGDAAGFAGTLAPAKKDLPSPRSLTKRYEDSTVARKQAEGSEQQPLLSNVIDLEGDGPTSANASDDEDVKITAISKPKYTVYDDLLPSDEEFPELARKAREKARTKRLQEDFGIRATPDPPLSTIVADLDVLPPPNQRPVSPPPLPDPVVSLLITSRLPGTAPLLVHRKLSQRLKEVRLAWCDRQEFTREYAQDVILTWRGKRLFDVTSCKSLGIGVDADGNIVLKGEKDIFGEEDRKIHIEAMTEEMLAAQKKTKERERDEQARKDDEEASESLLEKPKPEVQVRLILKAKDLEEFKLIVKPTTSISRMVNAFKIQYKIGPGREVYLLFDGERLDPSTSIADTEISDMDNIEVYVR
ncbi:hypothetical protein MMC13_006620 [Lambiella insularis]|nr:hypothetical protein [Lambiella insularis]